MKRVILIALLIATVGISAYAFTQRSSAHDSAAVVKLFGGAQGFAPIVRPARVLAWRIDGRREKTDAEMIDGYPILSGPVVVDDSAAQALSGVLRSGGSYLWDAAKGCLPFPGVLVRFESEGTTTDVAFCLECDILQIYRDGRESGLEEFDPARQQIREIVRQIFPLEFNL